MNDSSRGDIVNVFFFAGCFAGCVLGLVVFRCRGCCCALCDPGWSKWSLRIVPLSKSR